MKKGDFVILNNDLGVIVTLEYEKNTPEDHFGVWFGEKNELNYPIYRTVPIEYCELITNEIVKH